MKTILTVMALLCAATALPQCIHAVEANAPEVPAENPFSVARTALTKWFNIETGPKLPQFNQPKSEDSEADWNTWKAYSDQVAAATSEGAMLAYTEFSAAMDKVKAKVSALMHDMKQLPNSANNLPQKINDLQSKYDRLVACFSTTQTNYTVRNIAAGVLQPPLSSKLPSDTIDRFDEQSTLYTNEVQRAKEALLGLKAQFEKIINGADGISDVLKQEIKRYQYKGVNNDNQREGPLQYKQIEALENRYNKDVGQYNSAIWLETMKKKLENIDQDTVAQVLNAKKDILSKVGLMDQVSKKLTALASTKKLYIERNDMIKNAMNKMPQLLTDLENMINDNFAQ